MSPTHILPSPPALQLLPPLSQPHHLEEHPLSTHPSGGSKAKLKAFPSGSPPDCHSPQQSLFPAWNQGAPKGITASSLQSSFCLPSQPPAELHCAPNLALCYTGRGKNQKHPHEVPALWVLSRLRGDDITRSHSSFLNSVSPPHPCSPLPQGSSPRGCSTGSAPAAAPQ